MEKTNNLNINLVDRIKMVATNRRLNQSGISRSKTNESIHENASQSEVESVVSSNAPQTIVTQVITTSLSADSPAVEVPEAGRSFIVSQSVGDSDHRRTAPTDATELSVRQITPLSNFLYHVNATIVGASVRGVDRLFCRYAFVSGPDWIVMGGAQSGCTSIGVRNRMQRAASILPDLMQDPCRTMNSPGTVSSEQSFCTASCVWNTVVQATYSSSNVFGWPQILLQVYTLDWMGREKIQAYGHIHLPPIAGRHQQCVRLFRPKCSTLWAQLNATLFGKRPEFVDFRPVAIGQGRELLRFESDHGVAWLQTDVILKDFIKHGFVAQ